MCIRDRGKGMSVWDVFCEQEGKIYNKHSGETACDHYNRLEEDLNLMQELGIKAYRFSVSWSRILPNGIGEVNQKGIDFYNRLIDGLVERGIVPYMTLFHWDYPYELYKRGHWLNRESVEWFCYYTQVIADNFGDRVKHFITMNEPQCFIGLGYLSGEHAPGLKLGERDLTFIIHHVLLAHGKSVKILRENIEGTKVGIAPVGRVFIPQNNNNELLEFSKRITFGDGVNEMQIGEAVWNLATYLDPVCLGIYPVGIRGYMNQYLPYDIDADLEVISEGTDFIGINIYQSKIVGFELEEVTIQQQKVGDPTTHMGWPVTEKSLYYGPKFIYERYGLPIIITENGVALPDWPTTDGKVYDPNRIDFLQRYITEMEKIRNEGVPIIGYFLWSLMDNFEWSYGYEKRFGLIYIDYDTFERIPKESFYWYMERINRKEYLT